MGCSLQLMVVLLAYAAIVDPVYTGSVNIPPNNSPTTTTTAAPPTTTTTAAPPTTTTTTTAAPPPPTTTTTTVAPPTTTTTAASPTTAGSATATPTASNTAPPSSSSPASSSSSSGSSEAATPTTTTADAQTTETTASIPRTTTTQAQSPPVTATDQTLTLTRTELITIICVAAGILTVMLVVSALCGCCLTSVRYRRGRYRFKPYNRHMDEYSSDDESLPPPKQDSSVYVQFDGIQPSTVPTGPAPPPYILPRYKPLNPYYHENPTRTYYHHGRVSDRPYRHFREVRPSRTTDYSRWDRSVPLLAPRELPRAWI